MPSPFATPKAKPFDIQTVLAELKALLQDRYPLPANASRLVEKIESLRLEQCPNPSDGHHMAYWLTEQLQAVVRDCHLRLDYRREPLFETAPDGSPPTDHQAARFLTNLIEQNYGLECVRRLRGNIGYLEFKAFGPLSLTKPTLEAAITFLAETSALIIDLRSSRGGHSKTAHWLLSHMIAGRQELIQYHDRASQKVQQYFSDPEVPSYFAGKPIVVLTSSSVLSAGEELAYLLRHLAGAILVGEPTAGGAHAGIEYALPHGFTVFMPVSFAVDPRGKGGWEGTGLRPDIPVARENALAYAHCHALKVLIEKSKHTQRKQRLQWVLAINEAELKPLDAEVPWQAYIGTYGPHRISGSAGHLVHHMYGWNEPIYRIGINRFATTMKHKDHLYYQFQMNANQETVALEISRLEDGAKFSFERSSPIPKDP